MSLRSRISSARFGVSALVTACLIGLVAAGGSAQAQQTTLVPGRNVNMVSGTQWPTGDPYLQRQNEPSVAASTRNPLHLLAGANDYRTVDVPFVAGADVGAEDRTGDAWLGLFKSFDGGQRWQSTLLPGYPQDVTAEGRRSPLYGYEAGADPVVRAGTNGLLYYAGLVFDRGKGGKNAIFVARFIDDNNKEASFREAGYETHNDPVRYLGASLVTSSAGTVFYDKPWMAVDIPRAGARGCSIPAPAPGGKIQSLLAGNVYVAYTAFTEDAQGMKSAIYLSVSDDCGKSWSKPSLLSLPSDRLNQGATLAVDPGTGAVYAAWRKFGGIGTNANGPDGFVVSKSTNFGRRFSVPAVAWAFSQGKGKKVGLVPERFFERWQSKTGRNSGSQTVTASAFEDDVDQFDQSTSDIDGLLAFRTNMYPTMAVDGSGRAYLAWAERRPAGFARIVMTTSTDGRSWQPPVAVADEGQEGHQIMPSLAFGGGKLALVYYDLREDLARTEYSPWIDDFSARPAQTRRTMDLRASLGEPGAVPSFAPSVSVSDYLFGTDRFGRTGQLQFNPPNLPMFKQGTAPFMGDYIDLAVAPAFVPTASGGWAYNLNGSKPVFHAVWTDNRDVRQPQLDPDDDDPSNDPVGDGNPWNDYTAPSFRTNSRFDPSLPLPNCNPANTGSRNQNIYTARLTTGLVVGSPGNSKQLSTTLQRAFVVFAQNTTDLTKAFRLTIANQPPGGHASFDQFNPSVASVDVITPYRSTAARTVYVTSSDPKAQVRVSVVEIPYANHTDNLSDLVILNPDIANPDIANPDIANPDIANPDIANAEVYNPDIANPDIANPDIANPDIANPDIANPDIANPDIANPDIANPDIANPDIANITVANPDIANPDIANPDIANPDIANPDIANPDIANPDIANAPLTDVTWTMTNSGNTTAAFNVNLFLSQSSNKICQQDQTSGCSIATQLILRKVYTTPATTDCYLSVQSHNVLVANIANPKFVLPGETVPPQNDPSATNATLWLAPGETAKITLRIADSQAADNVDVPPAMRTDPYAPTPTLDRIFFPTTTTTFGSVTPVVQQQGVDTEDVIAATLSGSPAPAPPLVTPLSPPVPSGTSDPAPTPLSISFEQQPTSVPYGSTVAASVKVFDQYGQILPNASVRLFLGTNPTGATLSGDTATSGPDGIATFSAIGVSIAGTGYTLAATAGQALPAVSNAFNVAAGNVTQIFVPGTAGGTVNTNYVGSPDYPTPGGTPPVDSGLFLNTGDIVTITATGTVSWYGAGASTPNGGLVGCQNDFLSPCPTPGISLVARIGTGPWQFVGSGPTVLTATGPGRLELAINDSYYIDNGGGFNVSIMSAAPVSADWAASGSGNVTLLNGGATGTPSFSYDNPGVLTGAWTMSRVAASSETLNLTYSWTGHHSYFMVTTGLDVFVNRGGFDVYVLPLVNEGPYVCCVTPSGGFSYAGATTVTVQSGDTYGFRLRGSHGDGAYHMSGTFNVTVGGTPSFPVNVIGSAGGALLDAYGAAKPTRVFAGTLAAGQQITVTATGLIQRGAAFAPNGPGGTGLPCNSGSCLAPSQSVAALLARVGGGPWQLVGAGPTVITAESAGFLEFGVNDDYFLDNTGAFVATVSWGRSQFTETVVTGDASILNNGTLVAANDLGASPSAVTVNGVTFGTNQGGLVGPWGPGGGDFSLDAFSANLDAILSDLQFSGTFEPVSFTIGGLTPGATYRLQLLFSNDLNTTGDRVNVTVQGSTWVLDDWQPNAVNLIAQFAATGSSVVVTFAPGTGAIGESGRAVLNGYVLHRMVP